MALASGALRSSVLVSARPGPGRASCRPRRESRCTPRIRDLTRAVLTSPSAPDNGVWTQRRGQWKLLPTCTVTSMDVEILALASSKLTVVDRRSFFLTRAGIRRPSDDQAEHAGASQHQGGGDLQRFLRWVPWVLSEIWNRE